MAVRLDVVLHSNGSDPDVQRATYNVGLSAGGAAGASVTARKMSGPAAATINYALYRDHRKLGRDDPHGHRRGNGNGNVWDVNVFGQVPPPAHAGSRCVAHCWSKQLGKPGR
ncbi:spore coat protein U domain-containing protein [Mesorhizobium sp. M0323]